MNKCILYIIDFNINILKILLLFLKRLKQYFHKCENWYLPSRSSDKYICSQCGKPTEF